MRHKRLILLALGLVLCCAPAHAGPVAPLVVAVAASWAGTAVAGAVLGAAAVGTVAFAAIQIGVATVIGMVAAKIMAPRVPTPEGQQINIAQPITYQDRVYGRARKGGPYALINFTKLRYPGWRNVNGYINIVIIAAHEIEGYVEHYLDDNPVVLGYVGSNPNFVRSGPIGNGQGSAILRYRGAPDQVADSFVRGCLPAWTEQHDMAGLAYGVVTARQHRDQGARMYVTGRTPEWTPVIDGNNQIFDPRIGERRFTRNWALCFAHELVEYQGLTVDWDAVAIEADVCEQLVETGDGTMRQRWRIGGTITDDMDFTSIRSAFATAADAFLFERPDGAFGFYVGRWMEPQVSLGPRDFIALQIGMSRDIDTANEFTIRYVEPLNHWKETPSGVWIADPDASRTRKEIQAFMVNDHHQACAIAKRAARSDRAEYRITGTLTFAGFDLIGHRFVSFDHPEMGVACVLEIQKLTLNSDRMSWAFEGVSTTADDWLLQPDEEPERPDYRRMEGGSDIDVITSLQVTAGRSTSGAASLIAEWTEQEASYRQKLRFSVSGTEEWQVIDIRSGITRYEQTGLLDGETYEWQIQNVSFGGTEGLWSAAVVALAVADSEPPPELASFVASVQSNIVEIDFVTPNSPRYDATRVYRGSGEDFADAVLIATIYGSPNISDGTTDGPMDAGTYLYWAQAINASGVAGPLTGPRTVTVL